MKDPGTTYWFKRRRYGYGWTPATWQGWALLGVYWAVMLLAAVAFTRRAPDASLGAILLYVGFVLASTGALLWEVASQGPRGRWRWGWRPGDDPREDE